MPHNYASAVSDFYNIHMRITSMQIPSIEFRTIEAVT